MAIDASQIRPVLLSGIGRIWRAVAWYVKGVTGESRYAAYFAHERAAHPERTPMTERQYWRCVYREQDENPSGRCC